MLAGVWDLNVQDQGGEVRPWQEKLSSSGPLPNNPICFLGINPWNNQVSLHNISWSYTVSVAESTLQHIKNVLKNEKLRQVDNITEIVRNYKKI